MAKPLKVIIVGGNSKKQFFKARHGWEVWGLNGIRFDWVKTFHRMFNIHLWKYLLRDVPSLLITDSRWAKANPDIPFYTCDKWLREFKRGKVTYDVDKLPNHHIFPRAELAKMPRGDYHCGSFDWMVAFAVYLGAKEIALHGVWLGHGGEPISSRACLEYWIGYATAKGVKVTCAPDCDLFHFFHLVKSHRIYSYCDTPLFEVEKKRKMG